jgi:hypothetical protein
VGAYAVRRTFGATVLGHFRIFCGIFATLGKTYEGELESDCPWTRSAPRTMTVLDE